MSLQPEGLSRESVQREVREKISKLEEGLKQVQVSREGLSRNVNEVSFYPTKHYTRLLILKLNHVDM